jgi:hypothetical protein
MITPGYFRALAAGLAIWLGLFLALTWTIDPYGVSPLRSRWHASMSSSPSA